MTTRRHASAHSDQPRTHRSQAKAAKAQPILLDRLDQALCRQNVVLKRAALQSVAAAAFGFHNANEFAAADLVPPAAVVLGRAELDDDRSLIVLQDPSLQAIYGIDERFFREALATSRADQYGISPYGDLVDHSGILDDRRSGVPVAPTDTVLSYTPDPLHLYAGETIHFVRIEIDPARPVLLVNLTRKALDTAIAGWCRENWALGANPDLDPSTLRNTDAVLHAYFAGDLRDRLIYAETKLPTPPQHAGGVPITVWTAHHGDDGGHRIYVDATEIGLHAQIRELLAGLWEDIEDQAGEFDEDADVSELIALYQEYSTMTITMDHASITLPAGSMQSQGPASITSPNRARDDERDAALRQWQQLVADGATRLGYDEWLRRSAQRPADALDAFPDPTHEARSPWPRESEHPEYLRSDWRYDCLRDPRTPDYPAWVDEHIRHSTSRYWLKASDHDVLLTGDRRCVAHFHHAVARTDKSDVSTIAPGDILTICDVSFVTGHVIVHLRTKDGTSITLDSRDRSGLLRLIKFRAGQIPLDVARHYPESDWAAKMAATGLDLSYATWVASEWARNRTVREDWMIPARLSRNPASRALTTFVYSQAVTPAGAGPHRQSVCKPGHRVHVVNITHGIDGASVTLMTEDGGEFTLHAKDRGGLFPISSFSHGIGEGDAYDYDKWLMSVMTILVIDVAPEGYLAYYKAGLDPSKAAEAARQALSSRDRISAEYVAETAD